MGKLYRNKNRLNSVWLQAWDYASEGMYFVTICTRDKACCFGDIVGGEMQLSEIGKIANDEWFRTPELRPDMNLQLGEFVVMPNHIHGIIIIGANQYNNHYRRDGHNCICRCAMHGAPTNTIAGTTPNSVNQFGPQRKNLASIIRGYKSSVTTYARKNKIPFAWQPRFHDSIIRSMWDYHRIENYIWNNPIRWDNDFERKTEYSK